MTFSTYALRNAWAKDERIVLDGEKYRVGRMSYGDYFLEPREEQGETMPFNSGTVFLKKIPKKDAYEVSYVL